MKQLIITKQVRISKELHHYLDVLQNVYSINSSQFIRQSIIEKLQRDMPIIRERHKEKDEFKCPF